MLRLGQAAATTDKTARFLLAPVALGQGTLVIDGRRAGPNKNQNSGLFEALVNVAADGQTNLLPFTIWLPRIDTQGSRGAFFCALDVTAAISGIGPFKDVGSYAFPGNLGRALRAKLAPLP